MCFPKLDRTVLSIIALTLAAGGALTVLTKYNVPQANQTFFGANPFAIKRDVIENTMNWLFSGIALCGVLIQAAAFIADVGDRSHGWRIYGTIFVVSSSAVVLLLWLTTCAGYGIARRRWLPAIVENQRAGFTMAAQLLRNDGLEDGQASALRPGDPQIAKVRQDGRARIVRILEQIENLLDLRDRPGTVQQRFDRLKPYFR